MADVSPSPSPSISLSRKLSNVNGGVSSKHIYDDVFYSAAPAKHKSSSFSLPVEDYGEIFGASRNTSASSIPVLDLPESGGRAEEFRKARSSGGVDYAGIFAGFGDDSVGVSFDDLVDQSKKNTRKNSSQKPRNGAERRSPSEVPNVSIHTGQDQATMNGPSLQSLDTVNQINVLYNKANQTSKHGSDGTIHIAHLHAVPGFTYLVDDVVPPRKSESAQTSAAGMDDGKGNINPGTGEKHRNLPRENIFRSNFKTRSLSGEVPSAAGMDDGKGNINPGTGEKHRNLPRENIFRSNFKTRSLSGEVPSAAGMDDGKGNINPGTGEKHKNLPRENIFHSNFKTRSVSGEVPSAAGMNDGKGNINPGTGEKQKNLSRDNIFHSNFKTRSFSGEVGPSASGMDDSEGNINPGMGEKHRNLSRENIFRSSFKTRSLSGEVGPPRRNKFLEPAAARMGNGNGGTDLDAGKKQRRLSGENICDTNKKTQPISVTASISPQSIFSNGDSTKSVNPSLNGLYNDVDRGKTPRTMTNDIITGVDYFAGKNPRSLHKEDVTDADVKAQTSSLEHPSTVTHSVVDNGYPHRSNNQKFKRCDNDTGDNGDSSPPFLDEEFDVNSAAAVSAAAMKKAIEEAETQICLAKEILKRQMSAGSAELSFKDTLKVKPTSKIKHAKMDDRFREKEICEDHAQLGTATQIPPKPDNGIRNGKAALGFEDRTKTDGAGPMCKLDAMETCSEHEREGGGEWEASKHFSQLFYGVKNRLVSFMSKQTDSEKNVTQKETTHGECLEQSGESASNMKVGDDSETEIQRKSYTPSWLSNREWASFKIGLVPEVNEPVDNMLHKSVASKLERHMEELGPASDVDKDVRMNDLPECEIEEDEVGVQQLFDQEIDKKKEMFSSVQDETQQEKVFEQCLKSSGNFSTDSDCMKLERDNSTLYTSEEDDERLEKVDSFIAHEGIEVVNGKDEGGRMNEVLEVGDIEKLSDDSCSSAASIEPLTNDHEWVQHNKIEEEGQQQVNLKELKDGVHLVEDTCEEKEGNKEADESSKIASTVSHSDTSEDDEKISRQKDQNNEVMVDMFIATEEAVENVRPMAATDDICKLDEVASQSSNEVGGHDQSNLYIENEAFELDGYTGASEDASVEDEKAYESTHAEGCTHDESNQSIETISGENRSKMDEIITPSEPKEKRQEPVSVQLVKELMKEELPRTSTQAPDAINFYQFQKERRDIDVAFQSDCVHRSETEVMFDQCDHDENTRGSNVDVSMENQVQTFVNESVEETNVSDADAAHNWGEEKHEPVEELELEDAGAVLDQGEEKHESSEKENARDADEALNQLKQKQNAEAAHRRRRWFGSREEAEAAEMPSLFKGTSITSEIDQNIEEKRKSMHTILGSADELVDGSGEDTNSKEADTGGVDHEGGKKRVEAAHKRKRWFENEGEGVTQQPTLFARNQTNLVGNVSENRTDLDDSLEDCIGNFSSKAREDGNVNDAQSQEVCQNPGAAATRRKRWFENGGKGGPAPRPSIFENNGLASGVSEQPVTRENAMEPEKHDEASMDEEKVDANCEVNESNGSRKYADEVNKREREKIAVERAIREARERAFAEAREKAERAAMERVTAEMLQKGAAAVQDTQEKGSGETASQVDKAFVEAKLRKERAAVERATAEARERALQKAMAEKTFSTLQKAMSEKTFSKSKEMGGRYNNERSSSMDTRHQSSNVNTRYSSHADGAERSDGACGESAQRRKAVLERNRRTMERAAKALEEKNMRDLLAQKEQAERNRYADALDGEVKRWCSGKEGNLRALLSTLHYVLGPDCGWQPIALTDLISATAVRKAYKRATLCVHPDKLQQRAATIQQKYICEKVFDLLKEAWHKFNPDER